MNFKTLDNLSVYALIFIAVILLIFNAFHQRECAVPRFDSEPDIERGPPPGYELREMASAVVGLVMVAGSIAVHNRAWGPFLRFKINLQPKQIPFLPPGRQQEKWHLLARLVGFLVSLVFVVTIVTAISCPNRLPSASLWFGIVLATGGLLAAASLVNVYLVLRVMRPRNRERLAQEPTPDIEQDAKLPPELEPFAQQLAERGYTRLGVARAGGFGKAAFTRYWVYSDQDGGITATLCFNPVTRHPDLLLTSMFEDGALLETHYRTAIRIERPDYVARSVPGDFDGTFTTHRERLAAFGEAHGAPLAVRSLEDYLTLGERIVRPHLDEYERALTRSWLGMPLTGLILAVGFFGIALLLYFPSLEMASLSCLIPAGYLLLVLAVTYTYLTVKSIFTAPWLSRESREP